MATNQLPSPEAHSSGGLVEHLRLGLLCYYLTSLVVVLGVSAGHSYFRPLAHPLSHRGDLLSAFANWDGEWYQKILTEGYTYDPDRHSSVAFFPAYPLLGRLLVSATGMRPDLALLVVTHVCLAAAFVVLAAYARQRSKGASGQFPAYVLLAFGLLPTTCFWRLAYSESLFLLCAIVTLYGMERRWPLPLLACIIGLATATRPVAVALLLPMLLHVWQRSPTWKEGLVRFLALAPLCCLGIAAYMAYQAARFDDPLAFARTQDHWRLRPPLTPVEKTASLLTLEPVWSTFNPSSSCCWSRFEPDNNPLFSLQLANPLYFLLAVGLTLLGGCKGWLNRHELSLSACLLLIPYLTKSQDMCMAGMGRFVAVAFPSYLVLGRLVCRLPPCLAGSLLGISAFLLGMYAALFASWYRIL